MQLTEYSAVTIESTRSSINCWARAGRHMLQKTYVDEKSWENWARINNLPISTQNRISTACNDEASAKTASQNQWYAMASSNVWENHSVLILKYLFFNTYRRSMIPTPNGISVLYTVSLRLIPTSGGVDVPNYYREIFITVSLCRSISYFILMLCNYITFVKESLPWNIIKGETKIILRSETLKW